MIHIIHTAVWGPVLLTLIVAAGLYGTAVSGCFQFRGFFTWWGATAGSLWKREGEKTEDVERTASGTVPSGRHSLSRVQTACTALAATIGTGNIVGVATALTAGGPGAVFWMWLSAFIGMMTAYGETSLGILYRRKGRDGRWFCGPCAYLKEGLNRPGLALLYGVFCLLASLGMGSMVQSNAIAQTLEYSAGFSSFACGLLLTLLLLAVISGGVRRIAAVTKRLIPAAAGIYLLFSLMILVLFREQIPAALKEILENALELPAVFGGVGGYGISRAFRYGMARGVFSNEAGLGSLAGLHGAAEPGEPSEQGMWAMFEVFVDTIVICTVTALVILCVTGGGKGLSEVKADGAALTAWCFQRALGGLGAWLIPAAMVVFAFATILAWYFLGRQTLHAVLTILEEGRLKKDGRYGLAARLRPYLEGIYLIVFSYSVFLGCVSSLTAVWELSDIWNGLMAFPNILALFLLRKQIPWPEK